MTTHPQQLTSRARGPSRDATTLADLAGANPRGAAPTRAGSEDATDPFSLLPSPPAPCANCGLAILWIPTTLDAWRCPTCFPPPVRKMVAVRVVLVDVDAEFGSALGQISPQWFKLAWEETRDRGADEWKRTIVTTPIRCAANGTALVDDPGDGGRGEATGAATGDVTWAFEAMGAIRDFILDPTLGPPVVDGVLVDDEAWWAIGSSDEVLKFGGL